MLSYLKSKRVLVVVAHPDDEVLGIGGTINQLASEYQVQAKTLILGEGITSRGQQRNPSEWEEELETHKQNIREARDCIGYQEACTYNFPDNRFDSVDLLDLVKVIEQLKDEFQPEIMFTHHGSDTNVDHQCTFNAVITATRPTENEIVKSIFTFETPSSTEWQAFNYPNYFKPNFFMPLKADHLNAKIKAMESYEYEKRPFPHPRSPEALKILAQKRGVEIGKEYAEAFMMIRNIAQ